MEASGNLPTTGDTASVTVPSEYVQDFRAAVVYEIRFEAECIVTHAEKVIPDERTILERLDKDDPDDVAVSYGDVRDDAKMMAHDISLYDQIEEATARLARKWGISADYLNAHRASAVGDEGEVELTVEGDDGLGGVAHVFESMARQIVGPRLKEALGVGPIDRDWLPKILTQIERVSWAAERAAEYHAKAGEMREGREAA